MVTNAKRVDGGFIMNGAKMWITNSPIADLAVVWAKLDGEIRGFIVERAFEGFSTPKIEGKMSLRASVTGQIVLEDVFVPEENLLPNVKGLAGRSVRVPESSPIRYRVGRHGRSKKPVGTPQEPTR